MSDLRIEEEFAQKSLDRKTLSKLLAFLKPYRKPYAVVLILEILWVALILAGPIVVQKTIDNYIPNKNLKLLVAACSIYASFYFFRWIIEIAQIRMNIRSGKSFLNDLRKAIFSHLQKLSMNYYDRTKHGRIIARADRDVDQLEYPFVWGPVIILSSSLSLIMSSFIMAKYSLKLFGMTLLLIPIMAIATNIFRKKGMQAHRRVRESLSNITANLAENISGVRVAQAFCREKINCSRFRDIVNTHRNNVVHSSVVWNLYFPIIMILHGLSVTITIIYGGHLIGEGELTIGKMSAFIMYSGMFFGPILELSDLYNGMLSGASAAERIFLLLDTEPSVQNRADARDADHLSGRVNFTNVNFKYKDDGPSILENINFSIRPGETVALVGETGAGKTSIAGLLARFYEATSGTVAIDDRPIDELKMESLHAHMGIVLQENFLFSGSVLENLRFGRPEATNEEIYETAMQLGTHEIFSALSDGYNTIIKEQGKGLSLGERQLICFTRAFVADPRILILDEATSAVDSKTEKILQSALEKLLKNRTSLVIAHRLSTIKSANRILVLEKGRVVEEGSHEELISKKGSYYSMYEEYIA
ncbi:MAG: ABC transporter ATP-binding protein [Fibrobacteres bacterium]|nr:ABC transporter ATP-binding protein [Fibrobacterota bacterium]